jgi:Uma2 family endonuclease
LIYGAVRVADAPTVRHQQAVGAFYLALAPHVRERRLGTLLLSPLDVVFDYRRALVLQPDVVFISLARQSIVKERVLGAPDLVLEVLSPHPRIGRLQERVEWFAEYGVREIWLLHQDSERFDVLTTADGRVAGRRDLSYLEPIQSSVLPGFRMTVGDILRD